MSRKSYSTLSSTVIIILLTIVLSGCASNSRLSSYSQLPKISYPINSAFSCGCFDATMMLGGISGRKQDASKWGLAVILRPDSVIEYYSKDSLEWRAKFEKITKNAKTLQTEILLENSNTKLLFSGTDTLWLGMKEIVPDGASYMYVRYK